MLIALGFVAIIFFIEGMISTSKTGAKRVNIGGFDGATFIASIALSVLILVLDYVYGWISPILNDYENHRTETAYENNLIFKTFSFKMINSYSCILYLAFIKVNVGYYCVQNQCFADLEYVSIVFVGF